MFSILRFFYIYLYIKVRFITPLSFRPSLPPALSACLCLCMFVDFHGSDNYSIHWLVSFSACFMSMGGNIFHVGAARIWIKKCFIFRTFTCVYTLLMNFLLLLVHFGFSVYGRGRKLDKALEMFNTARSLGLSLDEKAYMNLVSFYGKAGNRLAPSPYWLIFFYCLSIFKEWCSSNSRQFFFLILPKEMSLQLSTIYIYGSFKMYLVHIIMKTVNETSFCVSIIMADHS